MYFSASLIFIMRDDVVAAVFERQQVMQQAYEDRIGEMRAQIDRVSSRQLLDQNSLEGKMHELISRQAKLETRSAVVAVLANTIGALNPAISANPHPRPIPRPASLGSRKQALHTGLHDRAGPDDRASVNAAGTSLPTSATSYAQHPGGNAAALRALGAAMNGRPRPHAVEVLPSAGKASDRQKTSLVRDSYTHAIVADTNFPVELRLGALTQSLDRIEAEQIAKVATVATAARQKARKLRVAIARTGLSAENLKLPAATRKAILGGPFVPYKLDPNGPLFERAVLQFQKYVVEADRLRRVVSHIPVRRPLPSEAQVSSGFGHRTDPFNGRAANHTGLDFRQRHGAPVYASATGRIIKAGYNGGYGKMVEIDHGNGLTSRYAHLSAISVTKGQTVKVGAPVGNIGSTGRSTGPHLHYEVRINDNPVNPARFIRAGHHLSAR